MKVGNWIYIDDSKLSGTETVGYCEKTKSMLNHEFNISHGLEPMKENVFRYLVESILKSECQGQSGYICVAYEPVRPDGISAIQTSTPVPDRGFAVEIITNEKTMSKNYTCYRQNGLSLLETIELFRKVLVGYLRPNLEGFIDITEMIPNCGGVTGEN